MLGPSRLPSSFPHMYLLYQPHVDTCPPLLPFISSLSPARSLPHSPTLSLSFSLLEKKSYLAKNLIFHEKHFSHMTSSLRDFTSRDNNCTCVQFGETSFISNLFVLLSISTLLYFPANAALYLNYLDYYDFCYLSWTFFLTQKNSFLN